MQQEGNIFRQFKTLESQQINTLSPLQMKNWLLALHKEGRNPRKMAPFDANNKNKYIHKTYNKRSFKQHVKQRITSIVSSTLLKLQSQQKGQFIGLPERSHRPEGKLKFKSTSPSHPTRKHSHFRQHISMVLKKLTTDELSCSICLQLFVCPAQTSCGHTFCYQCIDESLLFSHNCPNCRQNIRGCQPIVCTVLEQLISYKMARCAQKVEREHYFDRVKKFNFWRAKRMVKYDELQTGQVIDCRDTESIWCQAIVMEVYQKYDEKKQKKVTVSVLVHYNRWHNIYNQIIDVPSNRMAPLRYFSMRTDIPHYNLAEAEGNVRGSVITGVNRIQAPPAVHFIRIEESNENIPEESDSFFSELAQLDQEQQDLSRLRPNLERPAISSSQSSESEEAFQQRDNTLHAYINRFRRDALQRLNPYPNPAPRPQTIQIEDSPSEHSPEIQNYQDEFRQIYSPSQHQQNSPQVQFPPIVDSLQLYQQEQFDMLKDSSSEQQMNLYNPEQPSNLASNPLEDSY